MISWKVTVLPLAIILCTVFQIGAQNWQGEEWLAADLQISDLHNTDGHLDKIAYSGAFDGNEDDIAQDVTKSIQGGDITFVDGSMAVESQEPIGGVIELSTVSNAVPINSRLRPFVGRLSLMLIDDTIKSVDMDLYQNGELIFGCGAMVPGDGSFGSVEADDAPKRDEGIRSMIWWLEQEPAPLGAASQIAASQVAVSGSLFGNVMELDLISLEDRVLYKLHLTVGEDALWGSYNAYDYMGSTWIGSARGTTS